MQDQLEQAEPGETGPKAAEDSPTTRAGLAALLDPALDPLFAPLPAGMTDPEWSLHLPFLNWLLASTRPGMLVTLGARTAAAAYGACCDGVARATLPTLCRAIAEPQPEGGAGFPPALAQLCDTRHAAFSRLMTATAMEETRGFADGSVDLLVIGLENEPGWSGAAGTDRLNRWIPKLSARALLVVHGIAADAGADTGPWRALRLAHPAFEFRQGAGLGLSALGTTLPPGADWLFGREAGSTEATRLRERLALLGQRWRLDCLLLAGLEESGRRAAANQAERAAARDAMLALTAAHDRLRDELAFNKTERYRLERDAAAAAARLLDQDLRHRAERDRNEQLGRDRADATTTALTRQSDALSAQLQRDAAERTTAATALTQAVAQAVATAAATTDDLRAALFDAQQQVRRLEGSLSWRLTQPLRAARAMLRGPRPAPERSPLPVAATVYPLPPVLAAAAPDSEPGHAEPPPPVALVSPAPDHPAPVEPDPPAPQPALIGPGGWRRIRRILFVAGEPNTPGAAYRTERNAAACRAAGVEAECVDIGGVHPANLAAADLVVLWRAGFSAHVQTMLALAAEARTRVAFDVDDLIVQPALAVAEIIDGIRTTFVTEAESRSYFQSMQRTMLNCDLCTTTTRELAAAMGAQHPMVHVLPNAFDAQVERASRRAVRLRGERSEDRLVRLGYAGGTRTHQKDFATIVPSLASVLVQRPQTRLVLFRDGRSGEGLVLLDEFPELLPFADRIEWRDLVPLAELPFELARFDISLCPLEPDNPFCDSKSELKYFESALAGVCVVATPTGPFRRAVRHGVTGFLPEDEIGWTDTLLRLVDDPALRRRVARAANNDVLWRFGPRRQAELWALLLRELDGGVRGARAADLRLRRGDYPPAGLPEVPDGVVLFSHDRLGEARVTVGMTSFNYAQHLGEALESVAAQTLEHLDLVVVDDGSADGSVPLLLDWAERHRARFNRLRILRTASNAGLGGARNLVFDEAETPWIMVLDSDNRLAPAACETLLRGVEADGMAAFAYPRIQQFGGAELVMGADDFQPARLAAGNYIDAMALVAKWAWAAAGGYYVRRDAMGWEDFSLWCRMVELGLHGVPVPEELAFYRVHASSMVNAITEQSDNKRAMVHFVENRHPWLRLRMRAARKRLERPATR